ncbi:serine/threonine-protein phosphatase 6 regulatory ankyrin repeat subunit C-like [Hydractinia symbiolongicarpus]|uniref:serine/threonine-protein phosphatase 6 regulatory ankyrin repeat subunit C-like n=1 Tax=Hydractinia symbiolongicarpus TaxID=13093 RepID=UPI00254CAE85|nr:serine/threonine-protein phosphatase 6 regulatory ankyrin repeat subunit C-like [Hydractinia symbiolongicarpus]
MKSILYLIPHWNFTPIYFQYIEKVIDEQMQYAICKHAIFNRYSDALDYLLKNGIRYDIEDDSGKNLLHFAAQYGSLEEIKVLLKNRANVSERNQKTGDLPLHYAASNNTPDVVKFLSQIRVNLCYKNRINRTPLHNALILKRVAISTILMDTTDYMWFKDLNGNSPLHLVFLYFTSISDVRKLFSKVDSIWPLTSENKDGESPLLLALKLQNIHLMRYIFNKIPASIDTNNITDDMCSKLLQNHSSSKNTMEFLRSLFEEFRIRKSESEIFKVSVKLIYQAYVHGFNDLAQVLIQINPPFGRFCHEAVLHKIDRNFITFLLAMGDGVNSTDGENNTASSMAMVTKEERAVRLLLEIFTSVRTCKEDKITCLVRALEYNILSREFLKEERLKEILKLLIETLRSNYYYATNYFLDLLQKYSISVDTSNLTEAVRAFDDTEESKNQLHRLLKFVDVNVLDKNGELPLNVAVKLNKKQVVDILCENDAFVNISDGNGLSAIDIAIQRNDSNITRVFLLSLEKGSRCVNSRDNTLLHSLIEQSNNNILLKLDGDPEFIQHYDHVNVNAVNLDGNTPLDLALLTKNEIALSLLLCLNADVNISTKNEKKLINMFQQAPDIMLRMMEKLLKHRKNTFIEEIECPICTEVCQEIYICINGHSICGQCAKHPSIENCPMCRVPFKGNWQRGVQNEERRFKAILAHIERENIFSSSCNF